MSLKISITWRYVSLVIGVLVLTPLVSFTAHAQQAISETPRRDQQNLMRDRLAPDRDDPSLLAEERERRQFDRSDRAELAEEREARKSQIRLAPHRAVIRDGSGRLRPLSAVNAPGNELREEDNRENVLEDPNLVSQEDSLNRENTRAPSQEEELSDPYSALGIRVGSFYFYPQVTIETLFTDNALLTSGNNQSDTALQFRPQMVLESDWSRHSMRAEIRGTRNYHNRFSSEDDKEFFAGLRGRIDVTGRTNILSETSYNLRQEARSSINAATNAVQQTEYRTLEGRLGLTHGFNRMSVTIRGAMIDNDYVDAPLSGGGTINNDDRDYVEISGALRIAYAFKPGFSIFVEGQVNQRTFNQSIDDLGIRRGSEGHEVQTGVALDIGPKLRGEISVGLVRQNPDDVRLETVEGVVIDTNLTWRPTALTTLAFTAQSDVNETTIGNSSGALTHSFAVDLRHALRRHFILTGGLSYRVQNYIGSNVEDQEFAATMGGEYLLSRSTAIVARYQYTDFWTGNAQREYQENEARIGVRLRR